MNRTQKLVIAIATLTHSSGVSVTIQLSSEGQRGQSNERP